MTDGELRRLASLVAAELDRDTDKCTELALRVVVGFPFPGRVALRPEEAAAAFGVSVDYFAQHVSPHLRWFRAGRLKLVAVRELEAFLERHAALTLDPPKERP